MATAIRPTPVLYGADAQRFEERMHMGKKVSSEEKLRMKMAYETFKQIYVE